MRFRVVTADDAYRLAHSASSGNLEAVAISKAIVRQSREPCVACNVKFDRYNPIAGWFVMFDGDRPGCAFAVRSVCKSCAEAAGGIAEAVLRLARQEAR
jgi:hypothetical protein